MNDTRITVLRNELHRELTGNILPFWAALADDANGGFTGRVTGRGEIIPAADKGIVMHARILWTFASAYRLLGNEEYRHTAARAKDFILSRFADKEYGGVYWTLDCKGVPKQTKKQIYALGFAIYGLSEYARATGDQEALDKAVELFYAIEAHAFDPVHGGYFEAFARDWSHTDDLRLSAKDANERKTMNTHLHILEPYTNLYRVWPSPVLADKMIDLVSVFTEKICDPQTGHLGLFFGDDWQPRSTLISYGHDIEASWLLHEAALVAGDANTLAKAEEYAVRIARAASEGIARDGSIVYETDSATGHTDMERHWWPQAELVVGYYNLYQHFGDSAALEKALKGWEYVKTHLIDRRNGEWFWSVRPDGSRNTEDDKAGLWKCPYHNGRMCLEIIERTAKL